MWKGRTVILCAAALLVGNFIGDWISLPPPFYFILAVVFALLSLLWQKKVLLLLTMLLLGAASLQISRIPAQRRRSYLAARSAEMKNKFSDYLATVFPEGDELEMARALSIGDKSTLDRGLKNSYKASGAMHLLALSGLHVGIIYVLLGILLSLLGGNIVCRIIRSALTLIFLWSYAFISGMSNSICRAVIMITVYELSQFTSGEKEGPSALSVSAIIITLIHPEAPREIGFQLSYCAVISIYTLYPRLKQLLNARTRVLKYVWNSLSISISCQLTTGVIAYLYFGTFPFYFMITNLLAIPLVGLSLYLTAGAVILYKIPYLGRWLAFAAKTVIHIMNEIIIIISSL